MTMRHKIKEQYRNFLSKGRMKSRAFLVLIYFMSFQLGRFLHYLLHE